MYYTPVSFNVRAASDQEEQLSISIAELPAGEVTVHYEEATATVRARVDLVRFPLTVEQLDRFHSEFATELLAYVLNRGAMAQDSDGAIVYDFGTESRALRLPTNQEAGLGYPNSW